MMGIEVVGKKGSPEGRCGRIGKVASWDWTGRSRLGRIPLGGSRGREVMPSGGDGQREAVGTHRQLPASVKPACVNGFPSGERRTMRGIRRLEGVVCDGRSGTPMPICCSRQWKRESRRWSRWVLWNVRDRLPCPSRGPRVSLMTPCVVSW